MGANSYLYRMPSGIPGALTRDSVATIEAHPQDSATPFSEFGLAGKYNTNGKFVPLASGDAVSVVQGILVRPYPITGAQPSDPLGTSTPPTQDGMNNALKRGYMTVKCYRGTPALGNPVYVRVQDTDGTGFPIGSFTADQDTTTAADTPALPNAIFMGAADSNGNVEIAYNI